MVISQFKTIAARIATELKQQTLSLEQKSLELEQEQADLERRMAEVKADLDAVHLAGDRLSEFASLQGSDYLCPYCWMLDGVRHEPMPIPSDNEDRDYFKCKRCGYDFDIPI